MEPQIQYCTTSDGVNIAYYVMGEGPPMMIASMVLWSHLRARPLPEYHRDGRGLGRFNRIIRYDGRGTGLSDRTALDFSLDARVKDLEAVADHLGLDQFDLLGFAHAGPAAIAYAARHPDRLAHLVLFQPYANGADFRASLFTRALLMFQEALGDDDWESFLLMMANYELGYRDSRLAGRLAAVYREAMTPDSYRAFWGSLAGIDVRPLLDEVRVPTLAIYRRWRVERSFRLELTREVASKIAGCRFVQTRGGEEEAFWWSDAETRIVEEFLGVGEEPAGATTAPRGGFNTILFTDIEGSTALTERLGDAKAREVLREHERIVREALTAHGGSEIKTMGDGFMASFGSATKALDCAVAIQTAFEATNQQTDKPANQVAPLRVRIGLNAGEPVAEEGPDGRSDLFGSAVNMAARIAGQAQGGEILVSDVVRQLVAGKGFVFDDRGEQTLKGFEEPVRVYEVQWRE
jgi:class 3 adenylate cyclase/pimeloyl-ACP methyl ester carboxylesterase